MLRCSTRQRGIQRTHPYSVTSYSTKCNEKKQTPTLHSIHYLVVVHVSPATYTYTDTLHLHYLTATNKTKHPPTPTHHLVVVHISRPTLLPTLKGRVQPPRVLPVLIDGRHLLKIHPRVERGASE
jgi:hypothetical protein